MHYLILEKNQVENFYFSYSEKLNALKYNEPISDTDRNKIRTEDKAGAGGERKKNSSHRRQKVLRRERVFVLKVSPAVSTIFPALPRTL